LSYTFLDRIKILFDLIISSPFFISIVVIFLLTTFILLLYGRLKNKILKYIVAFGYLLIAALILIKYGSSILNLSDSLVDQVFSFLYFPNLIAYICMIIISILIIVYTFVNKKTSFFIKTLNIIFFVFIIILFILTLDVILKYNINIYEKIEVFNNETIVILIQMSTFIFAIWTILIFINYIVNVVNEKIEKNKFHEIEEKVEDKINVYANDINLENTIEFETMTDEEFKKSMKVKKHFYDDIFKK